MITSKQTKFSHIIIQATREGLLKIFDAETAAAVEFYVSPYIAIKNPAAYSQALERMFKEGAHTITKSITDRLCEIMEIEKKEWSNLNECVAAAKAKYESETSSTA